MLSFIKRQILFIHSMSTGAKLLVLLIFSIFLPSFPYYPFQPSVIVTISMILFIMLHSKRRKVVFNNMHSPLIIVFFILLLAVPLFYKNYYGLLCGLLLDFYFIIALYARSFMTINLFKKICDICCSMSIFCAIIGIIQKLTGSYDRVPSVFFNTNFYAYIIELVVIIAVYRLLTDKKYRLFYIAIITINFIAIFLTDCRSAWLGLFFGIFIIFAMLKKPIHMIVLAVIAVAITASVFMLPWLIPRIFLLEMASSIRMNIWVKAMQDFFAHPLFGRGMLAFYQISGDFITPHAHNIFIDILECYGIIGAAIILFYFIKMIIDMKRNFKAGNFQIKAAIAFASGIMCCTLVHGITDVPYVGIQTGALLFILMTARSAKIENNNE
jgi:O-antigen ligase